MKSIWIGALVSVTLSISVDSARAQSVDALPDKVAPVPTDYSLESNWLCRPGRADACTQDQTTTVIAANGQMTRETFAPKIDPPIDCFYVYPTASSDPGGNSDLVPGPEERIVAQIQFARFAGQCRTFAPMYRQVTLTSLHARMSGAAGPAPDRELPYTDVLAAWRYYLANENHGRGVVLIGHSQGAVVLMRLIRDEIDGQAVQAQLISAILLGANVAVPDGKDVGGIFKKIPACRAAAQTGCVISYVTFRDTAPPPPVGIFGHAVDLETWQPIPNEQALCTNPANLSGGSGILHSYFPPVSWMWTPRDFVWVKTQERIDTPFVSTPGLVSAQCVTDGPSTYLAIHVNSQDSDVRTHDVPGDVIVKGRRFPDWGLHRIDVVVAIGDLVDIVGQQSSSYMDAHR